MNKKINNVTIEGAQLIFKNFAGEGGTYNPKGFRNFGVIIPDNVAEQMIADGWNMKRLKDEAGEFIGPHWIKVAVNYGHRPPQVTVIREQSKTRVSLTEETIGALDYAQIAVCDLIITPYEWVLNDKKGVKAYLDSMYITISESPLDVKYNTTEESTVDLSQDTLPF